MNNNESDLEKSGASSEMKMPKVKSYIGCPICKEKFDKEYLLFKHLGGKNHTKNTLADYIAGEQNRYGQVE